MLLTDLSQKIKILFYLSLVKSYDTPKCKNFGRHTTVDISKTAPLFWNTLYYIHYTTLHLFLKKYTFKNNNILERAFFWMMGALIVTEFIPYFIDTLYITLPCFRKVASSIYLLSGLKVANKTLSTQNLRHCFMQN